MTSLVRPSLAPPAPPRARPRSGPLALLPPAPQGALFGPLHTRRAPSPAMLCHSHPLAAPTVTSGVLLLVALDRFAAADNHYYVSLATALVPDQASVRAQCAQGSVAPLDAVRVQVSPTRPLAEGLRRAADTFVEDLARALRLADGRPVAVRVTDAKWAATVQQYCDQIPRLTMLPGYDPLVRTLTALCMHHLEAERQRELLRIRAGREWAYFSGRAGRGRVRTPIGMAMLREDPGEPLLVASDGARNPNRGTAWGYFSADGRFRMGVCRGTIAAAELHAMGMAIRDNDDRPLVILTDSQRALGMLRRHLRSGQLPLHAAVADQVRGVGDLIREQRRAGRDVRVQWVHAHQARLTSTPAVLNDGADRLAKLALRRYCTPGLAAGVEDVALAIAHETARNLRCACAA